VATVCLFFTVGVAAGLGCSYAVTRQVAARTLGDIVRKLGEKVLPELIPILEHGLDSDDSDRRQGVCIGLSEIMSSTSRDHVSIGSSSGTSSNSNNVKVCSTIVVGPAAVIQSFAVRQLITIHLGVWIKH